ncbi:MAG: L,D-transpeptidase, partial [Pseudomonadota bacterium]
MFRLFSAAVFAAFLTFSVPTSSALAAAVVAKVDLSQQKMRVYVGGKHRYTWAVSTGRGGYRTPTGSYSVKRMHKMWYSRKYYNSPMPYSLFFRGGYAVHGTKALSKLGRPASHGCIRLHPSNAAALYKLARRYGGG